MYNNYNVYVYNIYHTSQINFYSLLNISHHVIYFRLEVNNEKEMMFRED